LLDWPTEEERERWRGQVWCKAGIHLCWDKEAVGILQAIQPWSRNHAHSRGPETRPCTNTSHCTRNGESDGKTWSRRWW